MSNLSKWRPFVGRVPKAMVRWLALAALFVLGGFAQAATFLLPAAIGSGPFSSCSFTSGTTYSCTSSVLIDNNDTVSFTQSMTLAVIGAGRDFEVGNNSFVHGNGFAVTITAADDIKLGNSFVGSVNFSAGDDFDAGNSATITGNVTAGDDVIFGNSTSVTGDVTAGDKLTVGSGTIAGNCTYSTTNYTCTSKTLSIGNASVTEGNSGTTTMTFTVTLSTAATSNVTVNYATSNGASANPATGGTCGTVGHDYTTTSGTASIAAGQTTATFNVPICGDTTYEANETFTVTLASPTNATLATATATGTITNDDTVPVISVADFSVNEGNANSTLSYAVTLSNASAYAITATYTLVAVSVTGGASCTGTVDFVSTGGAVAIAAGATTGTISIPICGDTTYEPNETFTVTLSSPVNATLGTSSATVTLVNDDIVLGEWRMDETSWNGTAGEVIDSSGGGNHGRARIANGSTALPTTVSTDPKAYTSGAQSTCNYGQFDTSTGTTRTYTYVELTGLPTLPTSFTFSAWIRSTSAGAQHQRILVRDDADNGWGLSLADGTGQGKLRFFNRNITNSGAVTGQGVNPSCGVFCLDTNAVITSNNWFFIASAINTTAKTVTLYVYDAAGTQLVATTSSYSGTWKDGTGTAAIGGETSASSEGRQTSWHFLGNIDEFQIYPGVLTATTIQSLLSRTRTCPNTGPHHVEIQHGSGTGLTCAASSLTIKACADASNPCTAYTNGVTGTLTATGTPSVFWDGATGGAAGAGFSIPSGSSTVTKNVQVTGAGSVVLGTSGLTPATTSATTCSFGSPSCTFTAGTAGFIFSNTATGTTTTIPAQVAGTATSANAIYLRAVQASTTNAAICTPAIISQNGVGVNMGYTCNDPTSCQAGNLLTVNATAVPPASGSVSMNFDANGASPIALRYDDVGQITVNASKTVTPIAGGTAVNLTGSTNAFVVKTGGFTLSNIKQTAVPQLVNSAAAIASDPKFVKAGESFSATVTATTSGVSSSVVATPNFGKETAPEGVLLTPALVAPSGGAVGALTGATITGGNFSGGAATVTNLAWSEVGIITLTPSVADGNYLGAGAVTGSASGNIGRFIPDHFAVTAGTATPACSNVFTYFGQDFAASPASNAFATPFTLTAQNLSNGTTQNYTDGFAKLPLTTWGSAPASTVAPGYGFSAATLPAGATLSASTTEPPTGNWPSLASAQPGRGVASVTAKHKVSRPTVLTGITSLTASAAPVDSDGVTMASTAVGAASNFYYGRLRMLNAYGSELLALPMSLTTEYWTTAGWVKNTQDSCTSVPVPDSVSGLAFGSGNLSAGETVASLHGITTGSGTFISGDAGFKLSKPGAGNTGFVTITIATPDWLKFPWVTAGVDVNASARATFGIFKSPLIYRRENY